jgi:hypothetical protein
MIAYLKNVAIGLDQALNAIFGGQPCDTISYRVAVAWVIGHSRAACLFCKLLNVIQSDHCRKTLAAEDHDRLLWGAAVAKGEHPL